MRGIVCEAASSMVFFNKMAMRYTCVGFKIPELVFFQRICIGIHVPKRIGVRIDIYVPKKNWYLVYRTQMYEPPTSAYYHYRRRSLKVFAPIRIKLNDIET